MTIHDDSTPCAARGSLCPSTATQSWGFELPDFGSPYPPHVFVYVCDAHSMAGYPGWTRFRYENRSMYAARMAEYAAEWRREEQAAIARGEKWHGDGQGYFRCDGCDMCQPYVDPYTHIGEWWDA